MLKFVINPYSPNAYHMHDHSIHIAENHRKKLSLNPTSSPELNMGQFLGLLPMFL
jgi:hypothetical protein